MRDFWGFFYRLTKLQLFDRQPPVIAAQPNVDDVIPPFDILKWEERTSERDWGIKESDLLEVESMAAGVFFKQTKVVLDADIVIKR